MLNNYQGKRAFDIACKKASKCRHERYQVSCLSCSDLDTCDIYKRVEETKSELIY